MISIYEYDFILETCLRLKPYIYFLTYLLKLYIQIFFFYYSESIELCCKWTMWKYKVNGSIKFQNKIIRIV